MRKLILATVVLTLSGLSPVLARGGMSGGMHGGGMMGGMHGGGMHNSMGFGLAAPANPTVPPALSPDPRLIGSAPLPPHQQPTRFGTRALNENLNTPSPDDAALDKKIGSICKGC